MHPPSAASFRKYINTITSCSSVQGRSTADHYANPPTHTLATNRNRHPCTSPPLSDPAPTRGAARRSDHWRLQLSVGHARVAVKACRWRPQAGATWAMTFSKNMAFPRAAAATTSLQLSRTTLQGHAGSSFWRGARRACTTLTRPHTHTGSLARGAAPNKTSISGGWGVFALLALNVALFIADHVLHAPWAPALYLHHSHPAWWQVCWRRCGGGVFLLCRQHAALS